jgi:hypothetical protein
MFLLTGQPLLDINIRSKFGFALFFGSGKNEKNFCYRPIIAPLNFARLRVLGDRQRAKEGTCRPLPEVQSPAYVSVLSTDDGLLVKGFPLSF